MVTTMPYTFGVGTSNTRYNNLLLIKQHLLLNTIIIQDVKISAQEIIDNLHFQNNTPIIPPGSVVYVSTDDPDGVCLNCYVQRKPCTSYETPKPVGCPEDVSANVQWLNFIHFDI